MKEIYKKFYSSNPENEDISEAQYDFCYYIEKKVSNLEDVKNRILEKSGIFFNKLKFFLLLSLFYFMLELISPNMKIIYNPILKVPYKIDYIIDPLKKLRGGRRNFLYDKRIASEFQLRPNFSLRGYSRGHLVPSFVMSWDKKLGGAWWETYRMTNIAIQNLNFNIGNWRQTELDIYSFAKKNKLKLDVTTGVSMGGKMVNEYFVPDYFFTTVRTNYDEIYFVGENKHSGKVYKVKNTE